MSLDRRTSFLVLALAACGGGGDAPAPEGSPSGSSGGEEPAPAPAPEARLQEVAPPSPSGLPVTPPPAPVGPSRLDADRIIAEAGAVHRAGLPSLSADGTRVAVLWLGKNLGGDAHDAAVRFLRVANGSRLRDELLIRHAEAEALAAEPTGAARAAVTARVERVNDLLGEGSFRTLVPLVESLPNAQGTRQEAAAGSLKIVFDPESRLAALLEVPGSAVRWSAQIAPVPGRRRGGVDACTAAHEPFVFAAHVDPDVRILVLRIGYAGTDLCPAPEDRYLVARLPER